MLNCPDFAKANPHIVHGFTTHELGNDYPKIAAALKIPVERIFYLEQVHSAEVLSLRLPSPRPSPSRERETDAVATLLGKADAIVTDRPGAVIGVKTADCIPLLAWGKNKNGRDVVAAIHAGWRGVLGGIIQNAVLVMQNDFACEPDRIHFAFGPCLRVKNFEFGPEDLENLRQCYPGELIYEDSPLAKPHLDLVATAKNILVSLGCDGAKINDLNLCTFERQDLFHSYRRGALKGRQFNFVGIRSA